jgi:hypothetical protein
MLKEIKSATNSDHYYVQVTTYYLQALSLTSAQNVFHSDPGGRATLATYICTQVGKLPDRISSVLVADASQGDPACELAKESGVRIGIG